MLNIYLNFFVILINLSVLFFMNFFSFGSSRDFGNEYKLNKFPEFSIIVVAHNEESTIGRCVKSIKEQDIFDSVTNMYLVDDGSDDSTWEKIKEFGEDDKIKIIRHEENLGLKTSRDKIVDKTYSEYLVFIDADTILKKGALKELFSFMVSQKIDACSPLIGSHFEKELFGKIVSQSKTMREFLFQTSRQSCGLCPLLRGHFLIIKRELYTNRKENFVDDLDLTFDLYMKNKNVSILPKVEAVEEEVKKFKSLINQYTRWFIGNISLFSKWVKLVTKVNLRRKISFLSLPILWYVLPLTLICNLFLPLLYKEYMFLGLLLYLNWFILIYFKSRDFLPCVLFPIVYSLAKFFAIFNSIYKVIKERKLFFQESNLFKK